jgi:glycosyltransferase involved in cell wall biosynthesis
VQAIPGILRNAPDLRFRFIGPSWPYRGTDIRSVIERRLRKVLGSLEFTGGLSPESIPAELSSCDVIVLPSRWENFPYACWESLASARAVIGSAAGGMAEVIEAGRSGLLVKPEDPKAIRDAILSLVRNPEKARALAVAGRARVLDFLDPAQVLPLQLASYERALMRCAARLAAA